MGLRGFPIVASAVLDTESIVGVLALAQSVDWCARRSCTVLLLLLLSFFVPLCAPLTVQRKKGNSPWRVDLLAAFDVKNDDNHAHNLSQ